MKNYVQYRPVFCSALSTVQLWISSPGKFFGGELRPRIQNHGIMVPPTFTTKSKPSSFFFASAAYLEHQTMSKALIHCILQRGPKASSPLREIHQMPRTPMIRRKRRTLEQKSIKRVSEGYVLKLLPCRIEKSLSQLTPFSVYSNDFRFQVSGSRVVHKLPKLKQAAKVASLAPKPFKQPPLANVVAINGPAASNKGDTARLYEWFKVWLKTNTPIILLNVGSICILVGFTRSGTIVVF
jgi:hypothetical protein